MNVLLLSMGLAYGSVPIVPTIPMWTPNGTYPLPAVGLGKPNVKKITFGIYVAWRLHTTACDNTCRLIVAPSNPYLQEPPLDGMTQAES